MGHKYRRKNKLRKLDRARKHRGWTGGALFGHDIERVVYDNLVKPNMWWQPRAFSSTHVEPFWHVKPNPTKPVSYDELMEWGKDPDDERSIGDLVGMKP